MDDPSGDIASSAKKAVSAIDAFSNAGFKNSKILESMMTSLNGVSGSTNNLLSGFSKLGGSALSEQLKAANEALSNTIAIAAAVVDGVDNIDEGLRGFQTEQFKVAGSLGETFEQSEKFGKSYRAIIEANSELSRDGLYIGSDDVKETITTLQKAGIAIDDLGKSSGVFGDRISYAQTMAAQAKAMGMTMADYDGKIAAMVRKNGLSMDDSMKLMAASQLIARDTGLRVDEVTSSLDSATSGFAKMGATIDFGRPILKGFAESIKDVGLGISQAGDLAATFSQSLLKIVESPALSYITSLKGGLGGTSGGVLNPSIQMQSKMLDQTPGAQADLARSLSEGMRDTLKSFTGGDIVTVKQAAESPDLQSKFYTQQQLLGSTYGISGTQDQNRVLEYLAKLQEATYSGDDEMKAQLEKQIQETLGANDKTFSIQEKMSQSLEKTVMILQDQAQIAKLQLIQQMKAAGVVGNDLVKALRSIDSEVEKGGIKYDKSAGEKSLSELLIATSAAAQTSGDKKAGIESVTPDSSGKISVHEGDMKQGGTAKIDGNIKVTVTSSKDLHVDVTSSGVSAGPQSVNVTTK